MTDPADLLVEGTAYLIGLRMVMSESVSRSRITLENRGIECEALGFRGAALDDLVEFVLRLIRSMVTAPPDPARTDSELRAYLRRWIAPDRRCRRNIGRLRLDLRRFASCRQTWTDNDQTPGYQFLHMMLQVLQHQNGRDHRWVLKSPQHLEQLGPILKVFPVCGKLVTV